MCGAGCWGELRLFLGRGYEAESTSKADGREMIIMQET
jgi:hypothetical protein